MDNLQEELAIAKRIIADQQIMLSRMSNQASASFIKSPDGLYLHIGCGHGILTVSESGEIAPNCKCFG